MLNEATKSKPRMMKNKVEFLMKTIMETYDKYFDEHRNFIQNGNCHLIFNLSTSPPIMDEAPKWIDHLLVENGGEPLLDVSKVSKEVYAEALMRFITHNRDRDNNNMELNVPDDVGRDNLTSTFNDGEDGRISPTESNAIFIDVIPIKDTTIEEEGAGLMPPKKSFNYDDYDVVFSVPTRQLSHESREPIAFSRGSPRVSPNIAQPPEREHNSANDAT